MTNSNPTRYVRYIEGGRTSYGILDGDSIQELGGSYLDNARPTGKTVRLADVKLTLPVDPDRVRKVIGVQGNYNEPGQPPRQEKHPSYFPMFHTSLITEGESIELPEEIQDPHHGVCLVVVIGKEGRNIPLAQAASHVFAVTVGNDITDQKAYDRIGGLFTVDRMLAKANDTWAPIANQIVAGLDYRDLAMETKLNGELAAQGRTSQMINSVEKLIHYLSHYVTLEPGDLLWTGSPKHLPGKRTIKPGDTIQVSIEGIGTLTNTCVARKTDPGAWWLQVYQEAAKENERSAQDAAAAAGPLAG